MSNASNTHGRRLYELAHLAELGVSMTDFQSDPEGCLTRTGQYDAIDLLIGGNRPLLPKQVALRTLWDAQWEAEGHCIVRHPHTQVVMSTELLQPEVSKLETSHWSATRWWWCARLARTLTRR